jgi:hypothetical protein
MIVRRDIGHYGLFIGFQAIHNLYQIKRNVNTTQTTFKRMQINLKIKNQKKNSKEAQIVFFFSRETFCHLNKKLSKIFNKKKTHALSV